MKREKEMCIRDRFQKYGCNMQFGGDDQWSNMLAGTELIRRKLGDVYKRQESGIVGGRE